MSASDMTERKKGLIRMVAERLVAVSLALLLAFSFPVLTTNLDMDGAETATAPHQSLRAPAGPDATVLVPVAETTGEFDRSRTGTGPAIVQMPAGRTGLVAKASDIFCVALRIETPCPATSLPPSRGPPPVS
jgi:hypothetical protein